jgi:hypothetical protein
MSIQMKPSFFISSTIRLTHIRHEFKVENGPKSKEGSSFVVADTIF